MWRPRRPRFLDGVGPRATAVQWRVDAKRIAWPRSQQRLATVNSSSGGRIAAAIFSRNSARTAHVCIQKVEEMLSGCNCKLTTARGKTFDLKGPQCINFAACETMLSVARLRAAQVSSQTSRAFATAASGDSYLPPPRATGVRLVSGLNAAKRCRCIDWVCGDDRLCPVVAHCCDPMLTPSASTANQGSMEEVLAGAKGVAHAGVGQNGLLASHRPSHRR